MNAIVSTSQSAEEYLELGLRDQWHPVLASWEVAANPVGITRLGENIVVWRDAEGQVHALEDRCPHRGAGTWVIELLAGITVLKFVLMVWLLMCQPFMNAQ